MNNLSPKLIFALGVVLLTVIGGSIAFIYNSLTGDDQENVSQQEEPEEQQYDPAGDEPWTPGDLLTDPAQVPDDEAYDPEYSPAPRGENTDPPMEDDTEYIRSEKENWEPVLQEFAGLLTYEEGRDQDEWLDQVEPLATPAMLERMETVNVDNLLRSQFAGDYDISDGSVGTIDAALTYDDGTKVALYLNYDAVEEKWVVYAYDSMPG